MSKNLIIKLIMSYLVIVYYIQHIQAADSQENKKDTDAYIASLIKKVTLKVEESSETSETQTLIMEAIKKIPDESKRDNILNIHNSSPEMTTNLVEWFIHEVPNPNEIFECWKNLPLEEKPILGFPKSWNPEREHVKIKSLEDGEKNDWDGKPLVVSGDHHCVAIRGEKNDQAKTFTVYFYDPYEPYDKGSALELYILFNFIHRHFPAYEVNVVPFYTKYQKLTAFGDCRLFAQVYYNRLMKGEKPEVTLSEEEALNEVAEQKRQMREGDPEYFSKYDALFQYIFDSGFAEILSNDIIEYKKNLKKEG